MSSKSSDDLGWLSYIVLGVWLVNSALILFLITRVDSIVNGQLYGYGLQFSHNWADPYWASLNLIYVFMGMPMVLSTVVLGIIVVRRMKLNKLKVKQLGKLKIRQKKPVEEPLETQEEEETEAEPAVEEEDNAVTCPPQEPKPLEPTTEPYEPKMEVINEVEAKETNGLLISCPHCKKVFNRPLVMLDFSSGKTRLVNVCPYCSHTLGEASDQSKDPDETTDVSNAENT
jgi:uncharacterized Zn-finger protein